VKNNPHLRNTVTDVLIGDLFTDKVDKLWEPLEAMYPDGKTRPPAWNDTAAKRYEHSRQNELHLPEGPRP
jgi:hypothetical protein